MEQSGEPKRSKRIRQRDRMIRRAERIEARIFPKPVPGEKFVWTDASGCERRGLQDWEDVFKIRRQRAVKRHDHLAACSCYLCGNPRRYVGERTLQERRQEVDDEDS